MKKYVVDTHALILAKEGCSHHQRPKYQRGGSGEDNLVAPTQRGWQRL